MRNIIIRMPNWLGDALMASASLFDIKDKWPDAKLTILARSNIAPLFDHHPSVDALLSFKKGSEVIQTLKQNQYDLGILFTNSISSAYLFWKGKVENRIGFKNEWRTIFLNKAIAPPKTKGKEHLVTTYKRLLLPLGIPLSKTAPALFLSLEEKKRAQEILKDLPLKRRLIGMSPVAAFGPAKCWLPQRFFEVSKALLTDPSTYLLFFGDKAGEPLIKKMTEGLPSRAINLAGKTSLRELIALIAACDHFLANDSGPMHLAAALKVPLTALFGSTCEIATGPYEHGHVIHKHVSCSPCFLKNCPIDFRCMKSIEVEEVVTAICGGVKR